MTVSNEKLLYETHFSQYQWALTENEDNNQYWHHQAQDMHTLCAIDGIGDMLVRAVMIAQRLPTGPAHYNLLYGVARRSKMISGALRQLYSLVRPDRRQPLPHDDVFEVERALNDIYIHAKGMIDNYAWTIYHLFGDDELKKLHHTDIGLFRRKFQRNVSVSDFAEIAREFQTWEAQLKERRDPVAHRIPLTVPPAILDETDADTYRKLQEKADDAFRNLVVLAAQQAPIDDVKAASDTLTTINLEMGKVGTFLPLIIQDPEVRGVPIYPTVAQDVGQVVILARLINSRIEERLLLTQE